MATEPLPDFCPLGCYWKCEHRGVIVGVDSGAPEPFLARNAQPVSGPSGLPTAPYRMGTRGL